MSGMVYEVVNGIDLECLDGIVLALSPDYINVFSMKDIKNIKKMHKQDIENLIGDQLKIIHIEYRLVESVDLENVKRLLTRYYFVRR